MDIPRPFGQKYYPLTHIIGFRPEYNENRTRFLPKFRTKAWVRRTENIMQTAVATWVGLVFLALLARAGPFHSRNVPLIVGSFGAEVVLLFAASTSPMAQPRNVLLAMPLSALLGVAISKAFAHLSTLEGASSLLEGYSNNWVVPATAVTLSVIVTQALAIPHPPAGATAILPTVDQQVFDLGWYYCGYIMTEVVIIFAWAMIMNNIGARRYPQYWISPREFDADHESEKNRLHAMPGSANAAERLA